MPIGEKPLIWVFASLPSLTREGGMGFSVGKGSASWNKQVQPASLPPPMQVPPPCHLAPPPPLLDPGREESRRRLTKGPTSWRGSPGNKWRASLGGSDSETAMAWRPAVTHSTSMGELSVEAESTKALFFPSFLFFSFFLFCPLLGGIAQHQGCLETCVSHHWLQLPP